MTTISDDIIFVFLPTHYTASYACGMSSNNTKSDKYNKRSTQSEEAFVVRETMTIVSRSRHPAVLPSIEALQMDQSIVTNALTLIAYG